ncbi:MAG: phage holin family protein [Sideroxydans sp.]|jgi:uncharacterized membrane protein YqjE
MPETSGLFGSLKRLLATLLGIVSNRVELLANEWEEERLRLTQVLLFALFALFCFCMGILFLSILIVLLFWQDHPQLAVSLLSLSFFTFALIFFRLLFGRLNQKSAPFADTLAELKKDLGSLRGNHE